MLHSPNPVGVAILIGVITFVLIPRSTISQSSDQLFRAEFTPSKEREPTILIRLFYLGDGSRTVFWPLSSDFKIISPGKWSLRPQSNRIIVTGSGTFTTQPITKEEPIVGFMNLKNYFISVTSGKNVISFEFPVKLPDEKRVVTIRKDLEVELTDEQVAHFSEPAANR